MQNNYELFWKMIYENEGIYSDHPHDLGGETHYGLTRNFLNSINYVGDPNLLEAKEIYKEHFWNKFELDNYALVVSLSFGDALVNHSDSAAIKIIQYALDVKVDGIIGPITKRALKKQHNSMRFWRRYREFRVRYYVKISKYRNNKTFLIGWLLRVHRVSEFLFLNGVKNASI